MTKFSHIKVGIGCIGFYATKVGKFAGGKYIEKLNEWLFKESVDKVF